MPLWEGTTMEDGQIRVIMFRDANLWVAQCLEYDIGVQAPDLETLEARLSVALEVERETSLEQFGAPFAGIDPAPPHFHEMWEKRSGGFSPNHPSSIRDGVHLDMALCA